MNETEKLSRLARRRGFFSQTAESYGGVSGFYTFGPEGAELKRNIEELWREQFNRKEGHREIEAPTIMPEIVFKASGHLDTFDDMIIECPECEESIRADHLVEDNTSIEEAESFSTDKIENLIKDKNLQCSVCGNELSGVDVDDFNLMFKTNIGPGDSSPGYLRPETAQGIFVEFPRFKEYARGNLPFGITQIGKSYRNEISPRKNIVRVREFTQAELEHFIDPKEDQPEIEKVKDVELKLYPREKQGESGDIIELTLEEALEKDIIESEWVGYYLGLAKKWYSRIGIDMGRFRFRQHQEDELSHYASDCWDAEAEVDGDWIEITGFAYRGCYDLKKHEEYSGDDYKIFKEYDQPIEVETRSVSPDMSFFGPKYGEKADDIVEKLEEVAEESPDRFKSENIELEIGSEIFEIPVEKTGFKVTEEVKKGEKITPTIIEPSFGIDRIFYSVLAHSLDTDEIDGESRDLLKFEPDLAPSLVAVFPLMDKDGMGEKARNIETDLRRKGFSVRYDDSGAIGRRYRRQDEIGTPFCVTVDHQTLEDSSVTIRERDSTSQKRIKISQLENVLEDLKEKEIEFHEI